MLLQTQVMKGRTVNIFRCKKEKMMKDQKKKKSSQRQVNLLWGIFLIFIIIAIPVLISAKKPAKKSSCPPPGTVVSLKKVMNNSFIRDYRGCDIIVEAQFLKTGSKGYRLGTYDTSANTTFQILAPGDKAQASFGGMSFGVFAGVPKAKSDILFELKQGDMIRLRGGPIGFFTRSGSLVSAVFHATAVKRK